MNSQSVEAKKPPQGYRKIAIDGDRMQHETTVYRVYKSRFYIMLVFSLIGLFELALLNTWAGVSESVSIAFGWDRQILTMLPWLGFVSGIISIVPMMCVLKKYGLRIATVNVTILSMIGTGLRCIPFSDLGRLICCGICSVISGFGVSLSGVAMTMLSATWFAPNERNKATAFISTSAGSLASAFSFLLPRLIINEHYITEYLERDNSSAKAYGLVKEQLLNLFYVNFGVFGVLSVCVLVYFPKEPPTPPSPSAKTERFDLKRSLLVLLPSKSFWLVLLSSSASNGVRNVIVLLLGEVLNGYGIVQSDSNMIGIIMSLSAIPSASITSILSDYRKTLMKPLLIGCLTGSGVSYACLALVCYNVIPRTTVAFYLVLIIGSCFTNGAYPLFYEYGCEISYPVGEEILSGLLFGLMEFMSAITLLGMILTFHSAWLAIAITVSCIVWIPFLIPLNPDLQRLNADENQPKTCKEQEKQESG